MPSPSISIVGTEAPCRRAESARNSGPAELSAVADLLGRPYCVGGEITEEEGSRCLVEISPSSALPAAGAYTGQIAFNEVGVSSSHPAVLIIPSQSAGTTRVHVVRRDGRGALTRHARSARVVFERGCLDGRPPGASHGGGPMPMHVLPREVSRVAHSVATLHDGVDASHGVFCDDVSVGLNVPPADVGFGAIRWTRSATAPGPSADPRRCDERARKPSLFALSGACGRNQMPLGSRHRS